MKTTIKLVLALTIFSSVGLAGDQQTGGYRPCDPNIETCPPPPPPDCTEDCGNGTSMMATGGTEDDSSLSTAILEAIESGVMSAVAGV